MRNTRIWYQYINKANAKKNGYLVVAGALTDADAKAINQTLEKGMLFIPAQVGVLPLAGGADEDHVWHRLDLSQRQGTMEHPTIGQDGQPITAASFVDRFSMAIWNPSAETARMYKVEAHHVAKLAPGARYRF